MTDCVLSCGSVGGLFTEPTITLSLQVGCKHYVSEEGYGVGQLRGSERASTIAALSETVGGDPKFGRNAGVSAMYNASKTILQQTGGGASASPAANGSAVSICVLSKANAETKSLKLDKDLMTSLHLMQAAFKKKPIHDRYMQMIIDGADFLMLLLFDRHQVAAYRQSISIYDHVFMDGTGNVVAPVLLEDSSTPQKVTFTSMQVQTAASLSRNSRPLRCLTMLSTDTEAPTVAMSLLRFRKVEFTVYRNNAEPLYFGMDLALNLRKPVLLVYNSTCYEVYSAAMIAGVRAGQTAAAFAKMKHWTIIDWCLWHCQTAVDRHCTQDQKRSLGLSKAQTSAVFKELWHFIRLISSVKELDERPAAVRRVLGSPSLCGALVPGVLERADRKVVFMLGGIDCASLDLSGDSFDDDGELLEEAPNPFLNAKDLDYMGVQWFPNLVCFIELFVGGRTRKCDATSEVYR